MPDDIARHDIGGNNPPSDVEILRERLAASEAANVARAAALVDACARVPDPIPDEITAARAASMIAKQVRPHMALIEERRKAEKRPFDDLAAAVQTFFALPAARLHAGKDRVDGLILAFQKKREAAAAEARRKAEEEARRQREEAERLAAAATTEADIDKAIAAEAQADAAQQQAAAVTAPGAIRSDYGAVASVRRTVAFEVVDVEALPAAYLMANEAAIKAYAKTAAKGQLPRPIPGVRWFWHEQAVSR
jgi:hypothetical protein